jgi:hypothetical protein
MLMNLLKRKRLWLLLVVLLLCGIVWFAWPGGKVARVKAMQKELFDPAARALPTEERREKWRSLREATAKLSPGQRQELSAERRKRRREEMARYSRMSPEEKARHLDEMIRRFEQRRREGGFGQGGPAGRANAGPGGAAGGQGGDRTAAREERRQERLDSSTPAERALMTQFFRDLAARRQQLGMPAGRGFGPLR